MIDSGPPKSGKSFLKKINNLSIRPREIKLIVLTHGDPDHAGSTKEIKEITGARIAIHEYDRKNLEEGINNWPPGVTIWGKTIHFLLYPVFMKLITFSPVQTDIILDHEEFTLEQYGIKGKIIFTPGHTPGSVSVLLDTGEVFVGCLAHSGFPFAFHPALPIFAEDLEEIKKSWDFLIRQGAKMIYPGHGNPFPVGRIMKYL